MTSPATTWLTAPPGHRHEGPDWLPRARAVVADLDRPPAGTVLEYGCGGGAIREAVGPADRYIAVDIVPAMLDACAKRGPIEPLSPEQFHALPDAIVDVVICAAVLWHMPTRDETVRVVRKLASVLRLGGHGAVEFRYYRPGDSYDPASQPEPYSARYMRSDAWRLSEFLDLACDVGWAPRRMRFDHPAQTARLTFERVR